MQKKWILTIVGVLVLLMGALPLLKPFVPQLASIPSEGMIYNVLLVLIGIVAIGYSFKKGL